MVFISSLIYFLRNVCYVFVGTRMSERIRLLLLCSFDSIANHNMVRSDAFSRAFKAKIHEFLKILALHINCKQTQQKMKKKKKKANKTENHKHVLTKMIVVKSWDVVSLSSLLFNDHIFFFFFAVSSLAGMLVWDVYRRFLNSKLLFFFLLQWNKV